MPYLIRISIFFFTVVCHFVKFWNCTYIIVGVWLNCAVPHNQPRQNPSTRKALIEVNVLLNKDFIIPCTEICHLCAKTCYSETFALQFFTIHLHGEKISVEFTMQPYWQCGGIHGDSMNYCNAPVKVNPDPPTPGI